jgi:hypothetical protein
MLFRFLLSVLLPGLFISCNQGKHNSGTIKNVDPYIVRADIVFDSSPALTPTLIITRNGDLMAQFATGWGDGMPGQGSRIVVSSDTGKTWSGPVISIEPEKGLTGLMNSFYVINRNLTKDLLLCYTLEVIWSSQPDPSRSDWGTLVSQRKFDSYYSFTNDYGKTFSEKKLLSDPVKRNDFSQGNIIELPNKELLWPWGSWGSEPLNGFRRSLDGGLTWDVPLRAWQDPPPGFDRTVSFTETAAAVCNDGTIVAIARVDGLPGNDKRFWQISSSDNGHSWSEPHQIHISGGSPAMYSTPQGQLWLAYRDGGMGPGIGLAVSDDNGNNWRFLYHLKDPKGEHEKLYAGIKYTPEELKKPWRPSEGVVGYPCFVRVSDRDVYVVFHIHNKSELAKKYPDLPFYIAGNLLRIPS